MSSTTSLSFETPARRNHHEYPHIPYISRNYSHRPTFLSLHIWVYLHSILCSGLQKTHLFCIGVRFGRSSLLQGRSGSSKVDDFGTIRKRVCDFLFVRHCDYGAILHRFWDTATYWLKIAYFSYPSLIRPPHSLCSPWNFEVKLSVRKLESWGYLQVKTPWS